MEGRDVLNAVDHSEVEGTQFLPHPVHGTIITDGLGRTQVNTYQPVTVRRIRGDPSPFLNRLAIMILDAVDRRLLPDWMAHNIKFPGYKVPWTTVIQSAEGCRQERLQIQRMDARQVDDPRPDDPC